MLRKIQLLLLFFFAAGILSTEAQSVITLQKEKVSVRTGSLDGKGTIVFKSRSSELVVTTSVKSDPVCDKPVKVQGRYEYRMSCDISQGSDKRVFTIALKGTTITEKTGQIQLFANKTLHYSVELVENPITMELSPDGSHFISEGNGWALIEFNSETPLTVKYSNSLKAKLKSGRSKARTYVDSLIINVASIKALSDELYEYEERIVALDKKYDEIIQTATDEELDKISKEKDELDAVRAEKEDKLYDMIRISIKGEDTNERIVDPEAVRGLASKGKLRYNVVLLTKTKTVFKTRYEELIHQAESHKHTRDYASAKLFYENAAEAEGATDADKLAALECAKKMGELAEYKEVTDRLKDKLDGIVRSGNVVNKNALLKMMDEVAERYDALYMETGDTFFKDEADHLRAQKDAVPVIFKGKCVTSDYKGGRVLEEPISGVSIYGSDRSNCEEMDKRTYPFKGELICTTGEDGTYSFPVPNGKYKTIIFEAPAGSKFKKNKHVSLEGRSGDRNVKVRFSKD